MPRVERYFDQETGETRFVLTIEPGFLVRAESPRAELACFLKEITGMLYSWLRAHGVAV